MRVEELKKQLSELKKFLHKGVFSGGEIINWTSRSVAFFSSLGVNESIITGFMRTFEQKETVTKNSIIHTSSLGPFSSLGGTAGGYMLSTNDLYNFNKNIHSDMVYISIAFKTAENLIDNIEESERLIPNSLINFFSEKTQYSQISSTLIFMEQNFKVKNAVALAENSISLLGSILNLEPSLAGKELSNQLRQIQSEKKYLKKFGVRSEVIMALNNSRILRNHLTAHKNIPIEYNVPFAVSLGTAYLVIMFLQITMTTGELIK